MLDIKVASISFGFGIALVIGVLYLLSKEFRDLLFIGLLLLFVIILLIVTYNISQSDG